MFSRNVQMKTVLTLQNIVVSIQWGVSSALHNPFENDNIEITYSSHNSSVSSLYLLFLLTFRTTCWKPTNSFPRPDDRVPQVEVLYRWKHGDIGNTKDECLENKHTTRLPKKQQNRMISEASQDWQRSSVSVLPSSPPNDCGVSSACSGRTKRSRYSFWWGLMILLLFMCFETYRFMSAPV